MKFLIFLCTIIPAAFAFAGISAAGQSDPEASGKSDFATCANSEADEAARRDACARAIDGGEYAGHDLATLHWNLGWAFDDLGDPAALAAYREASEISPTDPVFVRAYGWELGDQDQYEKALAVAERALELDPSHHKGYDLRAWLRRRTNDTAAGLEDLEIARALEPGDPWRMREFAWSYRALDQMDKALAEIDRAVRDHPKDAWNHRVLGYLMTDLDRLEEARAAYDQAIDIRGDVSYFYEERSYVLRQQARFDLSLADLDIAKGLAPNDPDIPNLRGWTLYDANRASEALVAFQIAIGMDETRSSPHFGLAVSLAALKHADGAIERLQIALSHGYHKSEASEVVKVLLQNRELASALKASRMINRAQKKDQS